jgi:hypothetical protein
MIERFGPDGEEQIHKLAKAQFLLVITMQIFFDPPFYPFTEADHGENFMHGP